MIRPIITQVILFLIPFAVYALFLAATRAGVLQIESWPAKTVGWLTAAAVLLMVLGFVALALMDDQQPAGSKYVPPHVKDGVLIPGHFE
jgi:hypothetical protein